MNEFDALLARAVEQARALGIPVSARISPRVAVNRRAVTRFGCCIRRGGEYVIELSERLLEAEERACMQTLAHEVLHTCPGCRNQTPKDGTAPSFGTSLQEYPAPLGQPGPLVKWLRHRPFTAVTRVRVPYGSPIYGGVAQPVEHLLHTQGVTDSSSVVSTRKGHP